MSGQAPADDLYGGPSTIIRETVSSNTFEHARDTSSGELLELIPYARSLSCSPLTGRSR